MNYDNPNGAATMPLLLGSELAHRPLTGGLAVRLSSSSPGEWRTI